MTTVPLIAMVDDHELLVEGLHHAFAAHGYRTVAIPPVRREAVVRRLLDVEPDLVLLDLDLGDQGDSTPLIRPLVTAGIRVLVVTGLTDRIRLALALEAGAIGHQSKAHGFTALVQAARRALTADGPLDHAERSTLLAELARARQARDEVNAPFRELTARERATLQLLCNGQSVRQIARAWTVSEATVRSHAQRILEKLAVGSQTQAVALALRSGWRTD